MLLSVWDVASVHHCYASIILCLVFYIAQKVFEYVFLVERAHQIRDLGHFKDGWWIAGMLVVLIGFGIIAGFAFAIPVTEVSAIDGYCRIGLPLDVTIPLLAYDVCLNFALTIQFTSTAWNHAGPRTLRDLLAYVRMSLPFTRMSPNATFNELLKLQIGRATLGLVAIIIPTIANLVILFKVHGHEQGWLCYTICTCDSKLLHSTPHLMAIVLTPL